MPERDGSIVSETYSDYRTRSYLRCISFCGLRGCRIPRDRVCVTLQRSFERAGAFPCVRFGALAATIHRERLYLHRFTESYTSQARFMRR